MTTCFASTCTPMYSLVSPAPCHLRICLTFEYTPWIFLYESCPLDLLRITQESQHDRTIARHSSSTALLVSVSKYFPSMLRFLVCDRLRSWLTLTKITQGKPSHVRDNFWRDLGFTWISIRVRHYRLPGRWGHLVRCSSPARPIFLYVTSCGGRSSWLIKNAHEADGPTPICHYHSRTRTPSQHPVGLNTFEILIIVLIRS